MARWTDFVIAHRGRIIASWFVVFLLGGFAAANLGGLLSNRFSVPGAESERGLNLLKDRMNDRSDGAFTLVAEDVQGATDRRAVEAAATRAARGQGRQGRAAARRRSQRRLRADLHPAGEPGRGEGHSGPAARDRKCRGRDDLPVGYPAINHDTEKIFNEDLGRGESIAVPI